MKKNTTLKIALVNQLESSGGAAKIAQTLRQQFAQKGHQAWLVVGQSETSDPAVIQFPREEYLDPSPFFKSISQIVNKLNIHLRKKPLGFYLDRLRNPRSLLFEELGLEDYYFPASRRLIELLPEIPDIIHLHNLHEKYFDLNYLPELSNKMQVVISLHDAWLLSGHCAHSLDCEKWRTGCGQCPYLESYPAIKRDATHYNWKRKKEIFSRSKFYVATPSRWILEKTYGSILEPAIVEGRVIHNGIDQSVFHPGSKKEARQKLGIPENISTLLFVAHHGGHNPYKDFDTIWKAVRKIAVGGLEKEILLLVVGQSNGSSVQEKHYTEKMRIRYIPYQADLLDVANYYRAADVYLQASHADTFPNVVLEALACGTPVIATSVGGIPEQILDGITGYLVSVGDSTAMAQLALNLLNNEELLVKMGKQAVEDARKRFRMDQMVTGYLDWYYEILERHTMRVDMGKP